MTGHASARARAQRQARGAAKRAHKLGIENSLTLDGWWGLLERNGFRCVAEGCAAVEHPQLDHIVPLSRGGVNSLENVQPLCGECHRAKTATDFGHHHGPLTVTIVGQPSTASDEAVARYLERFLAAERPGTVWTVDAPEKGRAA